MSDIFTEVDEEVRREQLKKLWERHQNLIIAGIALILIGVGSWRGYDWWQAKRAAESGSAFESAITLSEQDKRADAEAAFAKIAADGTSSYRALARLRAAASLVQSDPKAALDAYDKIATDGSVGRTFQDLAGLRAGMLLLDTAPFSEIRRRLEPLSEPGRAFRHSAREMLALAAWRTGDAAAAKRWFDMIMTDSETPEPIRRRVEMLMALSAVEGQG